MAFGRMRMSTSLICIYAKEWRTLKLTDIDTYIYQGKSTLQCEDDLTMRECVTYTSFEPGTHAQYLHCDVSYRDNSRDGGITHSHESDLSSFYSEVSIISLFERVSRAFNLLAYLKLSIDCVGSHDQIFDNYPIHEGELDPIFSQGCDDAKKVFARVGVSQVFFTYVRRRP